MCTRFCEIIHFIENANEYQNNSNQNVFSKTDTYA